MSDLAFNPWQPKAVELVQGALPCACGAELADREKQGRCVGPRCASYLSGREFPLRTGRETSALVSVRIASRRLIDL